MRCSSWGIHSERTCGRDAHRLSFWGNTPRTPISRLLSGAVFCLRAVRRALGGTRSAQQGLPICSTQPPEPGTTAFVFGLQLHAIWSAEPLVRCPCCPLPLLSAAHCSPVEKRRQQLVCCPIVRRNRIGAADLVIIMRCAMIRGKYPAISPLRRSPPHQPRLVC